MKINIIRIILIVFLIINFIAIFEFSNQSGERSGGISKRLTEKITKNIKVIQEKPMQEKDLLIYRLEKIIRKIAHFSIYTITGILLMSLMYTYNFNSKNKIGISLLIGIVYAITDEFHQLFIPGRSAQITDVIIDGMGVMLGILLVILVAKFYKSHINKCKKTIKI